jgi:predicted hydrolase (HD superfamily)
MADTTNAVRLIEKAGMDWDEFVDVSLASMVKIADEIGL